MDSQNAKTYPFPVLRSDIAGFTLIDLMVAIAGPAIILVSQHPACQSKG